MPFGAAVLALVAPVLAWSRATASWREWRDWRLACSIPLAVSTVVLAALHVAESLSPAEVDAYQLGYAPHDVVALGGSWWVSDPPSGLVYRVHGDEIDVPIRIEGAFELAVLDSTVWVSRQHPDGVTLLDVDGSVVAEAEMPAPPPTLSPTL